MCKKWPKIALYLKYFIRLSFLICIANVHYKHKIINMDILMKFMNQCLDKINSIASISKTLSEPVVDQAPHDPKPSTSKVSDNQPKSDSHSHQKEAMEVEFVWPIFYQIIPENLSQKLSQILYWTQSLNITIQENLRSLK